MYRTPETDHGAHVEAQAVIDVKEIDHAGSWWIAEMHGAGEREAEDALSQLGG